MINVYEELGFKTPEFLENHHGISMEMDKMTIDSRLNMAQVRIDQVFLTVSKDSSYSATAEKLMKISALIEECKQELSSW